MKGLKGFLVGSYHNRRLFLSRVEQFFGVSTIMLFLVGRTIFLVCWVVLTKVKVVNTTLCKTYVEKKRPKTPSPPRPPGVHLGFFWREKKFDRENSYETFCGEDVPEQPLQTHRNKPSSIISASSIATMGIFP